MYPPVNPIPIHTRNGNTFRRPPLFKTQTLILQSFLLLLATRTPAAPYTTDSAPRQTTSLLQTWQDPKRSREIPLLICYPKDLGFNTEKAPIILFSHGLGGSRETYRSYGEQWASHGYVVLFPQHHGSDTAVIGHGMAEMLAGKNDLQPFLDRVADIHFLIDQLELLNAGKLGSPDYAPFTNHLDLSKIGMSGHSFGAITTQALIGQHYTAANASKFADPRIKAAIVMSGSGSTERNQDAAFGSIKIPAFYLTGTEDKSPMVEPTDRLIPFEYSTFPDTFLLNITGANHMTFAPAGRAAGEPERKKFQPLILDATTAFWDAYLKGDPAAKSWFTTQLPTEVAATAKFESKLSH